MDYSSYIKEYIALEQATLEKMDVHAINEMICLLQETRDKDGMIYIFGNGGSAATASHFQNDFNKGISEHTKKKFRFQCLSDNIATLTAIANDIGYEEVFRFQLEGRLQPGDIVIAISGSGNSQNVIRAVSYAKECGAKVIGLTGYDGGELRGLSDISVHVPIGSMQITEDIHMVLDHLVMSVLYQVDCGMDHCRKLQEESVHD